MMMCMLAIGAFAQAQQYNEVGYYGNESNAYFPTYSYYNYSLTQQIYTADELGSAGNITSLSFYANSGSAVTRDLDVYMVLTETAAFETWDDVVLVTAADKVFTGTVNFVIGDWTTLTLDTPFAYDGAKNIALVVHDKTGSWTSAPYFRAFQSLSGDGSVQALYGFDDYTEYDPTVATSYTSGTYYGGTDTKNVVRFGGLEQVTLPTTANLPTNSYYKFGLTQQIYTAAEIDSTDCDITGIAFMNMGDEMTRNIDVYLVPVDTNAVAGWVPADSATLAACKKFSGEVTFAANAWTNIPVRVVNYDGSYNIAVLVDDNTDEGIAGLNFLAMEEVVENSAWRYFDDDSSRFNPDPFDMANVPGVADSVRPWVKWSFGPKGLVEIGGEGDYWHAIPSFSYYPYSVSQQIYTVQEIGMDGTIVSVAYKPYNTGTRNVEVYMSYTDEEVYTTAGEWLPVNASEKVFEGTVNFLSYEWTAINLSNRFEYDGIRNLVITFVDNTGNQGNSNWYSCFDVNDYQAQYDYSSTTAFDGTNLTGNTNGQLAYESDGYIRKNAIKLQFWYDGLDPQLDPDLYILDDPDAVVLTPVTTLDLGFRPNHAWMRPANWTLYNMTGSAVNVRDHDFTPNPNYFALVAPEVPFMMDIDGSEELYFYSDSLALEGDSIINRQFVLFYDEIRSASVWNITAHAYDPVENDVWELATELTMNDLPYFDSLHVYDTAGNRVLYDNYLMLPMDTVAGNENNDAVYKITFDNDVILNAYVYGENGKIALYREDFDVNTSESGYPGPHIDNMYLGAGNDAYIHNIHVDAPVQPYDVVIGDEETEWGSAAYPMYNFYNYSISQTIYRAAELSAAGMNSSEMTQIGYNAFEGIGNVYEGVKIWMGNVANAAHGANSMSTADMTLVFEGDIEVVEGWNMIDIAGFAWDGTSDLVVSVENHTGDYTFDYTRWLVTPGSEAVTAYAYNDYTEYDMTSETYAVSTSTYRANTRFVAGGAGREYAANNGYYHYNHSTNGRNRAEVEMLNEGFEGGAMPDGWTATDNYSSSYQWTVGTGSGYSSSPVSVAATGDYNAYFYGGYSGNYGRLITPAMNLGNATSATLTFKYCNPYWAGGYYSMTMYYRVDGGEWIQLGDAITNYVNSWVESGSIELEGLADNYEISFYVAKYNNDYGYGFGLDDVLVTAEVSGGGGGDEPGTVTVMDTIYVSALPSEEAGYVTAEGLNEGVGVYEEGTTVEMTATANDGWHFVMWENGETLNPRTVTVNANNAEYSATFEHDSYVTGGIGFDFEGGQYGYSEDWPSDWTVDAGWYLGNEATDATPAKQGTSAFFDGTDPVSTADLVLPAVNFVGYSTMSFDYLASGNNRLEVLYGPSTEHLTSLYGPAGTGNSGWASVEVDLDELGAEEGDRSNYVIVFRATGGTGVTGLDNIRHNQYGDADASILEMPVEAGTYYLVVSATQDDFEVRIDAQNMPCPEVAYGPVPADDADALQPRRVDLSWTLGQYTTGWRLVFGTTYWPDPNHEQTIIYPQPNDPGAFQGADGNWYTSELAQNYTVYNLWNNTNYFWRVDQMNSNCAITGDVWGFTTTLNVPGNLRLDDMSLFEGEDAVLRWDNIEDRTFRQYNIYVDDQYLGSTDVTYNPSAYLSYVISGLTYNMNPGYKVQVSAVYDEGESPLSEPLMVKVSGYGTMRGHVYEQDGTTGIRQATVTFTGKNEFGEDSTYVATTNNAGLYTINMQVSKATDSLSYWGLANKDGYYDNVNDTPYFEPVPEHANKRAVVHNQTTTTNFNMDEYFAPVPDCAVWAEYYPNPDEDLEYVRVYWSMVGGWDSGLIDFETGDLSQYGFTNDATYPWVISTDSVYDGNYSLRSGNAGVASSTSAIEATANLPYAGSMSFAALCMGEGSSWDVCKFILDGTTQFTTGASSAGWQMYEYELAAGNHTFRWEYSKDSSVNPAGDGMMIDNIQISCAPSREEEEADRSFAYYRIYRANCYLPEADTYSSDDVVLLGNNDTPADPQYVDVNWENVPAGVYKWGVSRVYEGNRDEYPNGRESKITWTCSCIDKDMYLNNVDIQVLLNSADSPEGTRVNFVNLNEAEQAAYAMDDVILDETGYYEWETFRKGEYQITVSKPGYETITETLSIWSATHLRYVMIELLTPISELYVSRTGWAMWNDADPNAGGGGGAAGSEFSFGFEEDPVACGWSLVANNIYESWERVQTISFSSGDVIPHEGEYQMELYWDYDDQDEWLITPAITLPANANLNFWMYGQYGSTNGDHYYVKVSTDGGNTWTAVWDASAQPAGQNHYESAVNIDLSAYAGQSVMLGWNGYAVGGLWYAWFVDDITVSAGREVVSFDGRRWYRQPVEVVVSNTAERFSKNGDAEPAGREVAADRHVEGYKVLCTTMDGEPIFNENTTHTFCQVATETYDGIPLVEGDHYICKVAVIYSTGQSPWTEAEWEYEPCDHYANVPVEGTSSPEGNLLTWNGGSPVPPPVPPTGNATIILTAPNDIWGDGSGYQMFLDADATVAAGLPSGNFGGSIPAETLAEFEYSIPANADGNVYTSNVISAVGVNTGTVEVPAGMYDVLTVNPDGSNVWVVGTGGQYTGVINDMTFESGKTYTFTVVGSTAGDGLNLTVTDSRGYAIASINNGQSVIGNGYRRAEGAATSTSFSAVGMPSQMGTYEGLNYRDGYLQYGDDTYGGGIGTGGGQVWWAVMYTPAQLAAYNGQAITKVGVYSGTGYGYTYTGNYTASVYQGGTTAPGTLMATKTENVNVEDAWYDLTLDAPVTIDASQNLWLVFNATLAYPMSHTETYVGDMNSTWASLDGVDWDYVSNLGVSPATWMIRALVTEGAPVPPTPLEGVLGYMIFRDGEWVAELPGSATSFVDEGEYGDHDYLVRVIYDGTAELPSNNYYYAMSCGTEVFVSGELVCEPGDPIRGNYLYNEDGSYGALISWGEQIEPVSEWLYYFDETAEDISPIGTGSNADVYWGMMIPADMLSLYAGTSLTQVSVYQIANYSSNPMTVNVFLGGSNAPQTLVSTMTYTPSVFDDFQDVTLTTAVPIDGTQNLWITLKQTGTYPALGVATTGNANARWISLDGVEWEDVAGYGLNYDWLIAGYVTNEAKGGAVTPIEFVGSDNSSRAELASAGTVSRVLNTNFMHRATRSDIVAYNVYRSTDNVIYDLIAVVPAVEGETYYEYFDETVAGEYYYQVTALYENGCESYPAASEANPAQDYVTVMVTGIDDNMNKVALYPNPTHGLVKIEAAGMRHITVVSVLGQVVYDTELSADEYELNMAQWNAGVYVVRIATENGVSTQRVTVVR